MPTRDLHDDPFDPGTIAKLEIFEGYAQMWIPTWVQLRKPEIHIFDFFAGTGYDKNNVPGSPIRILDKIKEHIEAINQFEVSVILHLNEYSTKKSSQLELNCKSYLEANSYLQTGIEVTYYQEDFKDLFPKLQSLIRSKPSLVYLDQNGLKFLSEKYLLPLFQMPETDFLYFSASSYLYRLGDVEEFRRHLSIDFNAITNGPYELAHRNFVDQLKHKIPSGSSMRLYPFSIKKPAGIYGIIFGASSLRAVDKFLTLAWTKNKINGEADYDIDHDTIKAQQTLFGPPKLTKIQVFKQNLRDLILKEKLTNNFEVLNHCYDNGHIGTHAKDVLFELKNLRLLKFMGSSSPCVNYDKVYKASSKKPVYYDILVR